MKYFLLAGEASGDLHASNLIHALRECDAQAEFVGMGGDKMRSEGCTLFQDYRNMAFMGVFAVLKNLKKVKQNFQIAHEALLKEEPDVLILIDYPSFNLKIATFCNKHLPDTKIVYYIPPKVWAWKRWRVHKIAKLSDKVLGIFPFETDFYKQFGYDCTYVGNPTVDSVNSYHANDNKTGHTAKIALLPGSRRAEIRHCLPTMIEAARDVVGEQAIQGKQYEIVVTAAPGIEDEFYKQYIQDEALTRDTYELLHQAAAAVVNSGTAILETALIGCPQTAVYYIATSKWLGWLKPFLFRIPNFTLVNIIAGRVVIEELIAWRFSRKNIHKELTRLLNDEEYRDKMLNDYREIRETLGQQPAAKTAAEIICQIKTEKP